MSFLVLPDSAGGAAVAADLPAGKVIAHASGRPWIVGDWSAEEIVYAEVGARRLVLLGPALTEAAELTRMLSRVSDIRDLDVVASTVPGNYHLVASMDSRVRFQGTISTTRQVFSATVDGTPIAADRPQSLAQLIRADIDAELLAVQLLAPCPPWPLSERCLWRGIEAPGTGCFLLLDEKAARSVRWWSPPAPQLPLTVGAEPLRQALRDAVAARARGRRVSADLSGGMDSTSLCFLAAGTAESLLTVRWEAAEIADDDAGWARRAAAALPAAEHVLIERAGLPAWFAEPTAAEPDLEGPLPVIRTRARLATTAREVAARGAGVHLAGHGGDEIFFMRPSYLHTLVRTHPLQALAHVRPYMSMSRRGWWTTLAGLARSPSYGQWLASVCATLTAPLGADHDFGWGVAMRLPPWATADAADTVRRILQETAAAEPEPLAPQRAQHGTLQDVRFTGGVLRRVDRLTSRYGVTWQVPYLDDQVVRASLAIRLADRAYAGEYKPALAAAVRGIVPDRLLGRATKAEFSAEAYAGLRAHRGELLELCDDLALARLGLVDVEALRSAFVGLHTSSVTMLPLDGTLAAELWLRSGAALATGERL